jgi:hypothetical protein
MADDQGTPPAAQAGTDGQAPAATQTPTNAPDGASGGDEKTITLKESDYKNLISQRDRANSTSAATEAWVMEQAKKQDVRAFIKENKDKYPDVSVDDLMAAEDEDQLPEIAKRTQRRIDDAVQSKLKTLNSATAPELTPEQRAEKRKALTGKDRPNDAFEQAVVGGFLTK